MSTTTISGLIYTAFLHTGNGSDANPRLAVQHAMEAVVLLSRLEGFLGNDCPAEVSVIRSELTCAIQSSDREDVRDHIKEAHDLAQSLRLLTILRVDDLDPVRPTNFEIGGYRIYRTVQSHVASIVGPDGKQYVVV